MRALFTTRNLALFAFVLNVFIAHIAIPKFYDKDDFFIFFSWNLYSRGPWESVRDVTWDGGKTYLYRDYRQKNLVKVLDRGAFFRLLQNDQIIDIRKQQAHRIALLKRYCQCDTIEVRDLAGSMLRHFILKEPLEVIHSAKL